MKTVKTFGFFKKTLKTVAVLFTAGLLISFLYSCEIGLGGAVDTQPPTIKITNPPVDSVIRDNFALCGTYDDDGTIKSVSAVLTRPDKKGKDIELTEFTLTGDANIKGAGTWTIPVNALDTQGTKLIDDGTYQATISIKDAAGRVTTQNTTFTVDNTAPVIVLQRPGTNVNATLSNADTYGRVFSLEGLGADDNNIDHIEVMVYGDKEKTNLLYPVTLSNVPPSISMNVAEYGDEAYKAIYGDIDPADFAPAQFYCTIKAYDSAARYPGDEKDKTPEDSLGNSTDVYYLYENISKDVLKSTKITEVYHILSGTAQLDSSRSASETNAIISTLAKNEQKTGSFVLDPKNNPTFTLAGKPTLLPGTECLAEATDFTVPNDSDITIQASVGLDNSPIVDNENFKVYFQKAEFQNGKYVATGPKIYPEIDSVNGKKKSGSNYQFTVKVKSSDGGLEVSNAYLIGIDGEDENGQPFLAANNGYGFYILSTSSAPTLKEIDPPESTVYVKKDGSLTITGKTTLTEGHPVVSVYYSEDPDQEPQMWDTSGQLTQPVPGKTNEYAFELNIQADKFSNNAKNAQGVVQSKEFALEIRASNGGKSSSSYKTVLYDVNEPTVNELTVSPEITDSVNHNGKYILNGEVTIKALLEDAFTAVKNWHYEVVQGENTITGSSTNSSKVEFTFNTVQLEDDKEATINIIAEDKAGNILTYPIPCFIDQSTDKPTFSAQDETSWKTGVLNPYYINANSNNNAVTIKNIISGNIYTKVCDDDSVKLVKIEVQAIKPKADLTGVSEEDKANPEKPLYDPDNEKQASLKAAEKLNYYSDRTGKEISITHNMPAKSGFYLITQTVYDKNFVMAGSTPTAAEETNQPNYCTKASYVIKASGTGPQYNLIRDTSFLSANNKQKQLSVTIDIESGEEPFTIKRNGVELQAAWHTNTYVDSFTTNDIWLDQAISVVYEVTDMNGATTKTITYSKDNDAPSFTNLKIETNSDTYKVYKVKDEDTYYLNNKNQTFTISGLAEDVSGGGGVGNVHLEINNPGGNGKKIEKDSETGYFTGIKFAGCIENAGTENETTNNNDWTGTATIDITVTDIAGNEFEYPQVTVNFDTTAPTGLHKIDAKGKDIIFRIGNNDNDDIDENSTTPQWSESLDTDVGGKYANGTYGNAETIKIRGFFDDASGSGVDLVYYKVFTTQPDNDNKLAEKFLKDEATGKTYETQADGYFSLISPVEKRVFYTYDEDHANYGGTLLETVSKYYLDDVKYNFYTTISGLSSQGNGENYLVFVAVDKVGNAALESVDVPGLGTMNNYKINVDQVPPTVPNDKIYAPTSFYNPGDATAGNTFVVYGLAQDSAAGIRDASVKINGVELYGVYNKSTKITELFDKEDEATRTSYGSLTLTKEDSVNVTGATAINGTSLSDNTVLWKVELNQSAFTGIDSGSSASLSLKVTDSAGAGNSETYPIGNVMIDMDGPVVTIKSPEANSTVNGKVRLSVTASDGNGKGVSATAPKLYKKNGDNYDELSSTDHPYNSTAGEFTVDTTKFADNANVVLRVSFDDQLKNTGNSSDHTLAVNQDTDRPIIKMNQVKSDGSGYLTSKTVFGSVTDDDGTINKLWVWSKKLNSNTEPSAAPSTSDNGANWTVPDGWIEFGKEGTNSTLENNNWQIDSTEADGTTIWFWAVADADNSVFWTKGTTSPYITYSNVTKQTNTTGISFKYDTESPEINSVELLRLATNVYKTGTTRYAASEIAGYVTDLGLEWSSANNMVFGKDYALMYAKVEVTEQTGMDSTTPLALDYITLGANDIYVTGPDTNKKYTYYLGPFDLHNNTTASPTLTITAKDAAGKTSSKEKAIVVDNKAEITISEVSPAADEIASGKFTLRGQVSDAQSSVTKVEYYIPKYSENTALNDAEDADAAITLLDGKTFTHITTATSIQFSIDFNNFNSDILKYTTNGTEVSVDSNFAGYDIGDNVYQIPVWFKVTDSVGNIGYVTDIQITYDPNEDRPKVYITDPEISATPVEKGGRIKISGNAQDNEGIAAVYLQFDLDGNNTDNWTNSSTTGAVLIPGTTDVYGFKATNTKNWNYTLDVSSGITDETVIKVRAIAQDNDTGLLSAWTDVLKIKVNNSIPYLDGDMYLRQYSGNTVTVEKKYEPNMYVKGAWKLEGTISTPSSDYLHSMTITVNNGESKSSTWNRTGAGTGAFENSNNAAGVTISYKAGSNDKSMNFSIPVSGSAKCEITIETTDNAPHTGTEKPEINIDNTPASFADYSDQANHKILLYQDSYGAGGTLLGSSNYVQNSNGAQFTLAGKIVEEQSGFDKAVFYFKRTGSDGVKRVYNPMEGHGTDNQANRANIASTRANAIAETGGTIYINNDKLPVRPLTVTRGTTETAQNDEIKINKNIRVGGLVYLGGLYRLITDVNRTTGTVTFEPEAATSNTDAEFVYGLVVDHNGERDNGAGGVDFDDGDGLLESYSGSTTANFRWEATFNSANIPDGPIDIYVVTFDKAGNIGYGYLTTKASNNAPRITKVMLGTDLNGNTKFDFGTDEFSTFYAFTDTNGVTNTTKGNPIWTLDTSTQLNNGKYWTAKNGIAVIPEFVGGAGPFYYVFEKGVPSEGQELVEKIKKTPSTFTYNAQTPTNNPVLIASGENEKIIYNGANATWTYGSSTSGSNTGGSLTRTNTELVTTTGEYSKDANGTEINPAVVYSFTFWDSTEESTPGTDTGSTILNAYVRQDLTDDVVPNSVIKPFEWTGTGYTKNVSTVVNGGQPSVVADNIETLGANDKLGITKVINGTTVTTTTITPKNNLYGASKENGHIELEADLSDTLKALQTGNPATALGGDPKVSGKITFHGTSYDNTRLSSIWFKFDNFTAGGGITSGGDTGKTGTNGYTQAAYYNTATATWVPATATMASNNWEFTVTDTYFNQTGHKVDWYLSIDTSKITNVAGLDKVLTVITLDSSAKVSTTTTSSSTDDAVNNVPTYQMDVVPYITKLYTGISDSAGDNLARSALGKYIVRAGETVKMFGFNLATGTNNVKVSYASGDPTGITTTEPSENDITKYGSHIDVPIGSNAESGSVSITVNSVSSLNNVNKNPAFTSITDDTITSVPYNSQANSATNNRLTDDVELWVWNMGYFLNETKPIYSPVMKMDASGNTYMAYGLGADQMILRENNTARIADYGYNKFVNTAVAYSSDGKAFGMGTCTDRIENHSASSVFYTWRDGNYKKVGGQNDAMGREYTYSSSSKYHLEKVYNNSTTIYDTDRVQRPKMEISGSSNGAKVYMVYYDHNNTISPIKFRYGVVSGTKQNELSTSLGLVGVTSNYNGYGVSLAENNNPDNGGGSGKNFHIVASSNTTFKSGPYTAVGYTSDGAAIVSWYDSSRKAVILSWNTSPASSTVGGDWQTNAVVIDDDYAGWYLNMCVDAADGIHLAYYNSSRGDLKYVYIPDYTEITKDTNSKVLTGATIVTVDSYLSVGTNISIGTRLEGEVYVPYIYYYNTSNNQTCNSVKVAWQKDLTTLRDGAINEKFTGAWESMTIPTPNIPTDSLICGGVPTSGDYKDTVVLGYLSDEYYEKAYIKGNIK